MILHFHENRFIFLFFFVIPSYSLCNQTFMSGLFFLLHRREERFMRTIKISDVTLKQANASVLSFREKIELVKLMDKICADVIELGPIEKEKADSLFIKSVCETVKDSVISVDAEPDQDKIGKVWDALQNAVKPRINIVVPASLVQMEYLFHKKPEALLKETAEAVAFAAGLTKDVSVTANDATRGDREFLYDLLERSIEAGASSVSVCDTAGSMFPDEAAVFIRDLKEHVPSLDKTPLGIFCSDDIALADACSLSAAIAGADEIKTSLFTDGNASLKNLAGMLAKKGSEYDIQAGIRTVELKRVCDQADRIFTSVRKKTTPFDAGVRERDNTERNFTVNDTLQTIIGETKKLGYDLTEEDQVRVYTEFLRTAEKKQVSLKEIDAIVASAALQVPSVYTIDDFIINSCGQFSATAHIRLLKNGEIAESVALGDGPVDAAFLAIEQIVGRHYELDDFQIQAVTEGREAMGETIVRLRAGGKVYAGRGLSTDIIRSSISAYINALNKIVYEEENE